MTVTQLGGPEVLKLQDIPEPQPGPRDLLVEVKAASINPVDFKIRRGALGAGRTLPFVPGYDFSGVVREVGAQVQGFKPGDEIYASPSMLRDGANAQMLCVDFRTAAHKPRTLDHVHAAAMPLVTLTAYEALYERVNVQAGDDVLIQAGGGGVGHVAIQLAKQRGCRVLSTASRDDSIALCEQMGADVVINYQKEDAIERVKKETGGRGCRVVFDCVGGAVFDQSAAALSVYGHLITIVGATPTAPYRDLFVKAATIHFEFMPAPAMHNVRPEMQGRILRDAAALVDSGKLRVHVSKIFDLKDLPEAHRLIESGHTTGKIVVKV